MDILIIDLELEVFLTQSPVQQEASVDPFA